MDAGTRSQGEEVVSKHLRGGYEGQSKMGSGQSEHIVSFLLPASYMDNLDV